MSVERFIQASAGIGCVGGMLGRLFESEVLMGIGFVGVSILALAAMWLGVAACLSFVTERWRRH